MWHWVSGSHRDEGSQYINLKAKSTPLLLEESVSLLYCTTPVAPSHCSPGAWHRLAGVRGRRHPRGRAVQLPATSTLEDTHLAGLLVYRSEGAQALGCKNSDVHTVCHQPRRALSQGLRQSFRGARTVKVG